MPPLAGVTTAPLLAADGSILVSAGYDRAHAMWCEPVPDLSVPSRPTRADARMHSCFSAPRSAHFPLPGHLWCPAAKSWRWISTSRPSACGERVLAALLTACCRPSLLARTRRVDRGAVGVGRRQRQRAAGEGDLPDRIWLSAFCIHTRSRPSGTRQAAGGSADRGRPAVFLDNLNSTALRSNTLASVLTDDLPTSASWVAQRWSR